MNGAHKLLTTTALAVVVVSGLGACTKKQVASSTVPTPSPWPGGAGSLVLANVPVAPGAYPDRGGDQISIRSKPGVRPETFTYGVAAPAASLANWYLARLQGEGWRIGGTATPNPRHPLFTVEAERPGSAVTAVIGVVDERTSRVTLLKLTTAR